MIELKAYTYDDMIDGDAGIDVKYYKKEDADTAIATLQRANDEKTEADKVIADLEESHKKEVGQLLMEIVKLKDIDSKNRSAYYKDLAMMAKDVEHHKYKRCLAMAKYCEAMRGHYLSYEEPKWFWYRKWSERWLELAEKFKEVK